MAAVTGAGAPHGEPGMEHTGTGQPGMEDAGIKHAGTRHHGMEDSAHGGQDTDAAPARSHRPSLPRAQHMAVTGPSQCHGESSRAQHSWSGAGSETASPTDTLRPHLCPRSRDPALSPRAAVTLHTQGPAVTELQVVYILVQSQR